MITEKNDPSEAADRAMSLQADPKVRAWMRRARKLFKDQPAGTWIYWQENQMHLMALGPGGERYSSRRDGSSPAASVDSITVHGSDAGAW